MIDYSMYLLDVGRATRCAPTFKCMDPILVSAVIGAGASLLGNVFGSSSNSSANKTNLKLAAQNREFQREMYNRQMAYNTDMWNKQNEYNDPSNQVERLRAAGINPYLALQNGNGVGVAQSAGGVTPPAGGAAQVSPFIPDTKGFVDSAMQLSQLLFQSKKQDSEVALNNAELESRHIDNKFKEKMYEAQLLDYVSKNKALIEDTRGKKWSNDLNEWSSEFRKRMIQNEALQSDESVSNAQLINAGLVLDNIMKQNNIRFASEQHKAQLALIAAQCSNQIAQAYQAYRAGDLSAEQLRTEIERQKNIASDTILKSTENVAKMKANKLADEIFDSEVAAIKAENRAREHTAKGVTPPFFQRLVNYGRESLSVPATTLSGLGSIGLKFK